MFPGGFSPCGGPRFPRGEPVDASHSSAFGVRRRESRGPTLPYGVRDGGNAGHALSYRVRRPVPEGNSSSYAVRTRGDFGLRTSYGVGRRGDVDSSAPYGKNDLETADFAGFRLERGRSGAEASLFRRNTARGGANSPGTARRSRERTRALLLSPRDGEFSVQAGDFRQERANLQSGSAPLAWAHALPLGNPANEPFLLENNLETRRASLARGARCELREKILRTRDRFPSSSAAPRLPRPTLRRFCGSPGRGQAGARRSQGKVVFSVEWAWEAEVARLEPGSQGKSLHGDGGP